MTKEEFVKILKVVVVNNSVKAVETNLEKPPGRLPQQKLVEMSNWLNSLESENKMFVKKVIEGSVEMAVFKFFCVLDGVSAIESGQEKGELILKYEKEEVSIWLNNPDEEYLHNML